MKHLGICSQVCHYCISTADRSKLQDLMSLRNSPTASMRVFSRRMLQQEAWTFLQLIGWFRLTVLRMLKPTSIVLDAQRDTSVTAAQCCLWIQVRKKEC